MSCTEKPELTAKEEIEVKKVARKILEILKAEKLKIERWRESEQVSSQFKVMISDALEYLPPEQGVHCLMKIMVH